MLETNKDIKKSVKEANLKLWQIAEKLNINDGNFSRKLRQELSNEEKLKIKSIIDELSNEGGK